MLHDNAFSLALAFSLHTIFDDIADGLSPTVDDTWLDHFGEHLDFKGEIIEHHHLDHGIFAIPLPKPVHRLRIDGFSSYKVWHE